MYIIKGKQLCNNIKNIFTYIFRNVYLDIWTHVCVFPLKIIKGNYEKS